MLVNHNTTLNHIPGIETGIRDYFASSDGQQTAKDAAESAIDSYLANHPDISRGEFLSILAKRIIIK